MRGSKAGACFRLHEPSKGRVWDERIPSSAVMLCHMLLPEITARRSCLRCGSAWARDLMVEFIDSHSSALPEPHVVAARAFLCSCQHINALI